jgi:hypothetical protein
MHRTSALSILLVASLLGGACQSDGGSPSTTTAPATTTTQAEEAEQDAALAAMMLGPADLPEGFTASTSIDDTVTAFCAGEDATAGLQASAREIRGFTRDGGGASVIQLAFRFRDAGAATFVEQADGILDRCSGVPDSTGLAFDYDALDPTVDSAAAAAEQHIGRHGINVGSQRLSIDVVVLRQGDVGQLLAVLGLDLPRPELDQLAATTLQAVAGKL